MFNGHIHNYERFQRGGVDYVITGGGGAEPYPLLFRGSADLYRDTGFPVYHYLTLEVSDHQLHAAMWKVKSPDDATLSVEQKDEFTIKARPPAASLPEKGWRGWRAHPNPSIHSRATGSGLVPVQALLGQAILAVD